MVIINNLLNKPVKIIFRVKIHKTVKKQYYKDKKDMLKHIKKKSFSFYYKSPQNKNRKNKDYILPFFLRKTYI